MTRQFGSCCQHPISVYSKASPSPDIVIVHYGNPYYDIRVVMNVCAAADNARINTLVQQNVFDRHESRKVAIWLAVFVTSS